MSVCSILLAVSFFSIRAFGQNIEFMNKDGINQWWHAFFISNMNENAGALTNVEIQDSTDGATWEAGYSEEDADDGTFYAFQNNNGWVLPLSIRLTNCAGDRIVFNDIIDTQTADDVFITNRNFDDSTCDTGDNIIIENKDGVTEWWHAFFINNANTDEITTVEFQDSSDGADWVTGYSGEDAEDGTFYAFQASGDAWVLPYSVRLTNCNNERMTANGVIISLLTDAEFDFGGNFEVADACPPEEPVNEDNIIVTKFQGQNEWWVALEIDGVSEGTTISSVELRDSGSNPSGEWITGVYNDWGSVKPWTFEANKHSTPREFVLPFDIRITDENQVRIVSNGLITLWDDGKEYDFGGNFN